MNTLIAKTGARPRLLASALPALFLLGSTAGAATVFSDDFSAPSRTGWYGSGGSSTALYTQNVGVGFTGPGDSSSRHMLTSFGSTTVAVGETLTLNFTFGVSGDTTTASSGLHQFRFGLFNSSGGGQPTKDSHGVSGTASTPNGLSSGFDSYVGYSGTMIFSNTSNQLGLRERGATAGQHLLTSAGAYTGFTVADNNLATDANTALTKMFLSSSEIYSVSLLLTRVSASQMNLVMGISGKDVDGNSFAYSISGTDSSGIVSAFDTFGFSVNNSSLDFMLHGISITQAATVPEPASSAALVAGLALACAGARRRRRA